MLAAAPSIPPRPAGTFRPASTIVQSRRSVASQSPASRAVFKAAEIPWGAERGQFTTRNLRTTFCMLAFQNGARPEELVQQPGHSMETLFGFYAEASSAQRLRALNAVPNLKRWTLKAVR